MERNHSPRAWAAWQEYKRIRAEDAANGYRAQDDPDHPHYGKRTAPDDPAAPRAEDTLPLPPPHWQKRPPEPEQEEYPRKRTLKDDGWD